MTDATRSFICGPGFCIARKATPADRAAEGAFEDWLQAYRKEHGEFPMEKEQITKLMELMKQAGRFHVVKRQNGRPNRQHLLERCYLELYASMNDEREHKREDCLKAARALAKRIAELDARKALE